MHNSFVEFIKLNKDKIIGVILILFFSLLLIISSNNNKKKTFQAVQADDLAFAGVINDTPKFNNDIVELDKANVRIVKQANETENQENQPDEENEKEDIENIETIDSIDSTENIEPTEEIEEVENSKPLSEALESEENNLIKEFDNEEFWDDMELAALVCVAEAEGESEYGKRLVIDTILNRLDSEYFPNTIHEVVYAPGQYECVHNGRVNRVEYNEYIAELVIEEYQNRTNSQVIYFRTNHYFNFGTPLLKEGSHYFSGR